MNTGTSFIDAIPAASVAFTLADGNGDYCSEGSSSTNPLGGLSITTPIAGDNRVDTSNDDNTQVSIQGAGVISTSSVSVWAEDTAAGSIGAVAASVSPNGTWNATLDISSLQQGDVIIKAQETIVGLGAQAVRSVVITQDKNTGSHVDIAQRDQTAQEWWPDVAPKLLSSDDLGDSRTDNVTSVTNPQITVSIPSFLSNVTATWVRVIGNDAELLYYAPSANLFPGVSSSVDLQLQYPLSSGVNRITYCLESEDIYSPLIRTGYSQPLYVTLDESQTGTEATDTIGYALHGAIATTEQGPILTDIYPCRVQLTDAEKFILTGTGLGNNNGVD